MNLKKELDQTYTEPLSKRQISLLCHLLFLALIAATTRGQAAELEAASTSKVAVFQLDTKLMFVLLLTAHERACATF